VKNIMSRKDIFFPVFADGRLAWTIQSFLTWTRTEAVRLV
jgi:hypothetical protein